MMMTSNDNNKHKYDEEVESTVATKRQRIGDDGSDDSSFDESSKETTEAEMEDKEVCSEEESMNQPDSSEDKLMGKRACNSKDGDTSSMESKQDSVRTSAIIQSDDCRYCKVQEQHATYINSPVATVKASSNRPMMSSRAVTIVKASSNWSLMLDYPLLL
jgi:hypothetical protein